MPQITPEVIGKYQELCEEHENRSVSIEDAEDELKVLLNIFQILYGKDKPIINP